MDLISMCNAEYKDFLPFQEKDGKSLFFLKNYCSDYHGYGIFSENKVKIF
jgi:hypothetical protein